MPIAHVVPQLWLVGGGAVTLLWALFTPRRLQGATLVPTLAALAGSVASSLDLWGSAQIVTFHGTWALDGIQLWATVLIAMVTAIVALQVPAWMATDVRHGEYHAVLLLGATGASLIAGATDTLELLVGMLLVSLTGYGLAAWHRASVRSTEAGIKYVLLGSLTNVLLLIGVVLLYGVTGATGYEEIGPALVSGQPTALAVWSAVVLVVVGLCLELGAVPAHAWVPDVAEGAPVPSAAWLTVAPKVGALVALARFVAVVPEELAAWRTVVAVVAVATMTLGNLAALWQEDVRRLLGWSTVSQAGYAVMAVVALGRSDLALPALAYFLAAYAAANLAAFGVVAHLRGRTQLAHYAGLSKRRPLAAAAMTVALLSLVGIPPLAGFFGKLTLFGAVIEAGYGWLAVVAVVNTVLSLFYYLRVIGPMYLAEPSGRVASLGRLAAASAAVATVAVVVLGLGAEPLLDASRTADLLPGRGAVMEPHAVDDG